MTLLVACGLLREARVIARDGVVVVAGGGDPERLERELDAAAASAQVILSSGIAGALDPTLKAGDVVISLLFPGEVGGTFLVGKLYELFPEAYLGAVVGSDSIVATLAQKTMLRARTGARAVDMESHIAARVAARHGIPCAALRTISDTASEQLPPAALLGMKPDGTMALGAVLGSLARNPRQLPALLRTGIGAERAFRALGRCHNALARARVGELDFLEFALDVG